MKKTIYAIGTLLWTGAMQPILAQQQFNALDYKLQKRPDAEQFDSTRFVDHLFLTFGIGTEGLLRTDGQPFGPAIHLGVGKWFTPVNGMRLNARLARPNSRPMNSNYGRPYTVGLTADYLLNLTNFGWGYNPARRWDISFFAGGGAYVASMKATNELTWAGNTGLIAAMRLNPATSLFIEPRLSIYGDPINHFTTWRGYDLAAAISAGFTYTMVPIAARHTPSEWSKGRFTDNSFVELGMGTLMGVNRNREGSLGSALGMSGRIALGKWFNPVNGLRLSLEGTAMPYRGRGDLYLAKIGADYLLSLDALAYGYDANQRFGINLVAGVELARPIKNAHLVDYNWLPGARAGFQGVWQLTSQSSFYIEPLIALNRMNADRNYNTQLQLSAGFIYHRRAAELRSNERFSDKGLLDNLFVSAGAGIQSALFERNSGKIMIQPIAQFGVGKWFTPELGMRLNARAGVLGEMNARNQLRRTKLFGGGVDLLVDLSNLFNGYDPGRAWKLIALGGGEGLYNTGEDKGLKPGAYAGLQGVWQANSQFALFIEPRMGAYKGLVRSGRSYDPVGTLSAGLTYSFRPYDRSYNSGEYDTHDRSKYFIYLAGGVASQLNTKLRYYGAGPSFQAGVGKWHTPLSGWRASVGANVLAEQKGKKYTEYTAARADYLLNLSTLAAGYSANHLVQVSAIAGLSAGASYSNHSLNFVPGAHVGLQTAFRVNDAIQLFVEPSMALLGRNYDLSAGRNHSVVIDASAGLIYRLRHAERSTRRAGVDNPNFISVGAGSALYANALYGQPGRANLFAFQSETAFGRWLTPVHGARIGLYNLKVSQRPRANESHYNLHTLGVHVDYLFNLSALVGGYSETPRFSIIGIAGAGYDFGITRKNRGNAPSGSVGVQALYRVKGAWSLYSEVRGTIYGQYLDNQRSAFGFEASAGISLGSAYRF